MLHFYLLCLDFSCFNHKVSWKNHKFLVCGNYKAIKSKNIKQKNVTKVPPTTVVKLHTEEL